MADAQLTKSLPTEWPVDAAETGRLDSLLARRFPERSRAFWKAAVVSGRVLVDGHPTPPSHVPRLGSVISWPSDLLEAPRLIPQVPNQPLPIVARTQNGLIICAKPAGWPCHPNEASETNTLANWLAALEPGFATAGPKPLEGGLLHRLDTETSGLLLAATTPTAWAYWRDQLQAEAAHKTYWAILTGDLDEALRERRIEVLAGNRFVTDWPIAHHATKSDRAVGVRTRTEAFRGQPRPARTEWRILKTRPAFALVTATVHQAQFHQIRVHAATLGCPLAADKIYGQPLRGLKRHALHAWQIDLPALADHDLPTPIEAPIPPDLVKALELTGLGTHQRRP